MGHESQLSLSVKKLLRAVGLGNSCCMSTSVPSLFWVSEERDIVPWERDAGHAVSLVWDYQLGWAL